MAPTLGYWDIRGLAQPIRLLLAYKEVKYEDKLYGSGPPPDYDRSQWLNEKFTLGLDFPNLPYFIDGDIKITQSLAILRHVARKNNLVGETEMERARADMLEQQLSDDNRNFVMMNYAFSGGEFPTLKANYLKTMPDVVGAISKFLGDRQFFAGPKMTYVDFIAYELIDKWILFEKSIVSNFPNLVSFHDRIEKIPSVAKYMASDKFIKWPLNGDMAKWGSRLNAK